MKVFVAIVILVSIQFTWAQISVPNNSPVSQNFDGMGTGLTLPTNWKIQNSSSPTWAGGNTLVGQQASTGTPGTGAHYNWGTTASERAVGAMTSGSFSSPNSLMAFYSNTHSTDIITDLSISYDAERYRINTSAASIQFFYSLNGTSWTAVTSGDIASASFPTGASSYTFASPLTINKSGITISGLNIGPNSVFYLRWNLNTTGSNSQGIGIDNVSLNATFTTPTTSISTGALSSTSFNTDCITSANGTVSFTSIGTFNSGNIYTVQLSNSTGSFTSPTNIGNLNSSANNGTISISVPLGLVSGSGYLIRIISSDPVVQGSSSAPISITHTNNCSLTCNNVTGGPFNVDCNNTSTGTVDFNYYGTPNPGNIYTVQLSNSIGSFTTPINIGSLTSTATSGTISFSIPANTPTGTGYRIRIIASSNPITGSNNGVNLSITYNDCTPIIPSSSGLIINEWSNGPNNEKEYYEFVVAGKCGTLVDIRNYILDDNNGTFTSPSAYSGTASGIAPGHFRFSNSMQWATIPVGSLIVIYNANDPNPSLPADDPNDSNNDSLYVIPHTSSLFEICSTFPLASSPDSLYGPCTYTTPTLTQWAALSLRNAGDAIQVRMPNGNYYFGVSYGGNEMTGGPHDMKLFSGSGTGMCGWFNSGDFTSPLNWSSGTTTGNETPGLPNNSANLNWLRAMRNPLNAICPIEILPTELIRFEGHFTGSSIELNWETGSEQNNAYFTVNHSANGNTFTEIGKITGSGNSSELKQFRYIDTAPHPGINYYQLRSTDYDGTTYNKGTIAVEAAFNFSYYNSVTMSIELAYSSDVEIYTLDGKLVKVAYESFSIPFTSSGLFLIVDRKSGITERLLIP